MQGFPPFELGAPALHREAKQPEPQLGAHEKQNRSLLGLLLSVRHENLCVKIVMGYPIAMKQSQGCCQAGGEQKQIQGGGGRGGGPSREVGTKMSGIDPGLRVQMQGIILNEGNATGIFVEII